MRWSAFNLVRRTTLIWTHTHCSLTTIQKEIIMFLFYYYIILYYHVVLKLIMIQYLGDHKESLKISLKIIPTVMAKAIKSTPSNFWLFRSEFACFHFFRKNVRIFFL